MSKHRWRQGDGGYSKKVGFFVADLIKGRDYWEMWIWIGRDTLHVMRRRKMCSLKTAKRWAYKELIAEVRKLKSRCEEVL